MKSYLKTIGIAVAVAAVGGGLYYMLVVKGGTLAVTLPKPFEITKQDLAVQNPAPTEDGAVLGESDPYENPLKDIYVNPFAK
jgi:hypothetical protein